MVGMWKPEPAKLLQQIVSDYSDKFQRFNSRRNQLIYHLFRALGSGGSISGRAKAFCLGRRGLNPETDLGFFQFRVAVSLF